MTILKILNLNLYNYNNWDERKLKIIDFIQKNNPDIIALQEVRDDVQFNKKGYNQAKQLNSRLNYPYYAFSEVTDKRKERPERYDHYCIEGIAVLSKLPIIKIEKEKLKKHPKDIHNCGNLYVRVQAEKTIDFLVVHFSNSDLFSLLHLKETLKQIKSKKITPIIAGDFNMWDYQKLYNLIKKDYKSSRQYKEYISYPPKKWTLDYILIPKEFKFKSFKCTGKGLSDHRALIAEVNV